ncbi:NUDIX hydrolase [Tropicibacter sp. Alg240-R139]|uniref:NUDIX hydrolase n=1 Tax=Tropicibacter sp. Alg240-R139 TaxID=2305991 RepID=UPI0013DEEEFF|nr:NUDIX hydrolase [Tropicibacter sp. Alg240-R139]
MTSPIPKLGALAVVIRDGHVLLAQRKKQPDAGLWGFPGGHVEWGETALTAATRELREETSVIADPVEYLTNYDLIRQDKTGQTVTHYLLVGVLCSFVEGTPRVVDEIADVKWVPFEVVQAGDLPMSARVADLLDLALKRAM